MADTKLFGRHTPGGIFTIVDRSNFPTGDIWYVDSTNTTAGADAAGYGRNPDTPFLTWVYAAETAAAAGDTIFLMPGHTETIGASAAAALTLSLAGARHIGLGGRTKKPQILVDAYADTYISVTGADTVIENITFLAGHSDIAIGIAVAADGVEIRKCDFLQNTTDENFLICIDDGGANVTDRLLVEDCTFFGYDTSNTHAISFGAAQDKCVIRNNIIDGFYETVALGGAGVVTNILIENNYIQNEDTDADQCIAVGANSTGIVVRNLVGSNVAGAATTNINCGNKMMMCENYSVDTVAGDVQGVLDPVATT
ncbi:MAG TPA: hypothetical protein VM243_19325 [Phycisphaerae bacterium]|nr:hypothetical protein [Phycisphaerae bacterium]